MNGIYLNKLLKLNARHALYREDGKWYHNLRSFPGVLFDKNGYIIFNTETEYLNNPDLQLKKDLHIKEGIEQLANYKLFTNSEKQFIGIILTDVGIKPTEETVRVLREISSILRKKSLSNKIKRLYNNTCQICGLQLIVRNGVYYSEVHHIVPLGNPHNGVDSIENMICVCPNHHVLLDLKSCRLDVNSFKHYKHNISSGFIQYHNSLIQVRW